jgi:hypothetical protein
MEITRNSVGADLPEIEQRGARQRIAAKSHARREIADDLGILAPTACTVRHPRALRSPLVLLLGRVTGIGEDGPWRGLATKHTHRRGHAASRFPAMAREGASLFIYTLTDERSPIPRATTSGRRFWTKIRNPVRWASQSAQRRWPCSPSEADSGAPPVRVARLRGGGAAGDGPSGARFGPSGVLCFFFFSFAIF